MKFIRTFLILLAILIQSASAFADPFLWKDTVIWTNAMAQALSHPTDAREEGDYPSDEDQALLERFKPRIYIAPDGAEPIDFYTDYLPYTVVRRANERDRVQERAPNRERLKEFVYDPEFYLEYAGAPDVKPSYPTAYGRVTRETVNLTAHSLITTRNFTFLKYHYIFLYGGLPSRLSEFKEKIARFIGDPSTWRELEYSSVYVILDEEERPLAIMLQQYDYFRTYIVSEKEWKWPEDGKAEIAFSLRSNQPYKLPEGDYPSLEFAALDFKEIPYIIGQGKEPLLAGKDLVYPVAAGATEVDYRLEYLPEFDPLYISRIPLGRRVYFLNRFENSLRRGSVGIDFCTWPQLVDLGNVMQFWYLVEDNNDQADFMREHMRRFFEIDFEVILALNAEVFGQTLKQKSQIQ